MECFCAALDFVSLITAQAKGAHTTGTTAVRRLLRALRVRSPTV